MARLAPPPNIMEALEGLRYPASASDILICAKAHHAAPEMLDLIRALPEQFYASMNDINNALGLIEGEDGGQDIRDYQRTLRSNDNAQRMFD